VTEEEVVELRKSLKLESDRGDYWRDLYKRLSEGLWTAERVNLERDIICERARGDYWKARAELNDLPLECELSEDDQMRFDEANTRCEIAKAVCERLKVTLLWTRTTRRTSALRRSSGCV